jgi:hypothetical protein
MPETLRILHTLATLTPAAEGNVVISSEEFIATYSVASKQTSSSPSGRRIGHYKAILEDSSLVKLHSSMMSLPFKAGFAPEQWTKVTDIMLETESNNPRCHCLHVLAFFESDLNHAKRVIKPQGTSMCSQGPRVRRIPCKSGHFFLTFCLGTFMCS